MQWLALEKLVNLYDGYRRVVQVDGRHLLLLQEAGQRYLVNARCPHYGQSLETGRVSDGSIVCPMHGYRFDLAGGSATDASGAAVDCRLPCYSLEYRVNEIGLWRQDSAGRQSGN